MPRKLKLVYKCCVASCNVKVEGDSPIGLKWINAHEHSQLYMCEKHLNLLEWCEECGHKLVDGECNNSECDRNPANEDNDNGVACERCKTTHCEEDTHYPHRLLWNSNKTGKQICRRCVNEEDEEE